MISYHYVKEEGFVLVAVLETSKELVSGVLGIAHLIQVAGERLPGDGLVVRFAQLLLDYDLQAVDGRDDLFQALDSIIIL